MKNIIALVLVFLSLSGCATNQFVYECVDWYKYQDPVKEWNHSFVTARSLDDAVQFFKTKNDDVHSFYCNRQHWTNK